LEEQRLAATVYIPEMCYGMVLVILPVLHRPPIVNRADLGVRLDVGAQLVFLPPQTAFAIVGEQDYSMDIMPIPFLPVFLRRAV
jgi:hypothetical protein